MQLKQEANTEPRKRFHLLARLRKAVKHGEQLEKLCESSRVEAKTKLEAQVRQICDFDFLPKSFQLVSLRVFFIFFIFDYF